MKFLYTKIKDMDIKQPKNKIIGYFLKHKLLILALIAVTATGGYYYKSKNSTAAGASYVLGKVEKGSIITSVSGSGQVAALNQIDVKPKASGEITNIAVKKGQEIKENDLIARIDNRDAQKTVNDARTALETAQLDLNKFTASPDKLSIFQAESALTAAKKTLQDLKNPDASAVSQAENALTSAEDTLAKLKLSQPNDYQTAVNAKQKAEDDLNKAYEDAFNDVANAFLDLPTLITKTRDILYSYEIGQSEISQSTNSWNISVLENSILSDNVNDRIEMNKFISDAESDYNAAKEKYNKNFADYKNANRYSDIQTIEVLLDETLITVKTVATTVKSENNMLDYWVDFRSDNKLPIYGKVTEYQTNLGTYTSKTNSHLSTLLTIQRTIEDAKDSIAAADQDLSEIKQNQPLDLSAAERSIKEKEDALSKLKNPKQSDINAAERLVKEKELALADLKAGADSYDIRAKKIAISEKQAALSDARQKLADYEIRAPFSGVIADITAQKGDSASTGAAIATLITKQKIAEIALNEVDAAKVKTKQKTALTFNAIEGLSITGEVADIDNIGTVSQGVVSYNIKIVFDTQDERVKPEMSVSAVITTDQKMDVLIVPNSAVKTDNNGASYVETIAGAGAQNNGTITSNNTPERKTIEIGLANDTDTEILSGLAEGDQIIIRTVSSTPATQTQTQQSSGLRMFGGMGR